MSYTDVVDKHQCKKTARKEKDMKRWHEISFKAAADSRGGDSFKKNEPHKTSVDPSKILIAYYSWSGATKAAAQAIQNATGGRLFEIELQTPCPADYAECVAQARKDTKAGARPPLSAKTCDVSSCELIFLGSPNWCGTIAPAVATFLESHDWQGKTLIPFITHGGGGLRNCEWEMRKIAPDARFLSPGVFPEDVARHSGETVANWARESIESD